MKVALIADIHSNLDAISFVIRAVAWITVNCAIQLHGEY